MARRTEPRAGTRCRTALAVRWRRSTRAVPTRVAARSPTVQPAPTPRLAIMPASTAPVPQASTVPPMRGSRGTRSGAFRARMAWSPSPGPLRFGTCPAATRSASTTGLSGPQPRPSTTSPWRPGVSAARSGWVGAGLPGRAPGTILPLGLPGGPPAAGRPMAVSGAPPGHMSWGLSRRWPAWCGPTCAMQGARPPSLPLSPTTSGHRPGGCLVTRSALDHPPDTMWRLTSGVWPSATTAS